MARACAEAGGTMRSLAGIRARVVEEGPAGRTATALLLLLFESPPPPPLGAADEDATAVVVAAGGGGGGGGGRRGGGGAGAAGGLPSITVPRSLVPSHAELICALAGAASKTNATRRRRRRRRGWIARKSLVLLRRRGVELASSKKRKRRAGDAMSRLASSLPLEPGELLLLRSLRDSGIEMRLCVGGRRISPAMMTERGARALRISNRLEKSDPLDFFDAIGFFCVCVPVHAQTAFLPGPIPRLIESERKVESNEVHRGWKRRAEVF